MYTDYNQFYHAPSKKYNHEVRELQGSDVRRRQSRFHGGLNWSMKFVQCQSQIHESFSHPSLQVNISDMARCIFAHLLS